MTLPLKTLKTSFEKIRKESVSVASEAHKIVTDGVQRFAEHELAALNDTYKSVLKAIKANSAGDSLKDTAARHLDLMQDTITKLISSAKASLSILGDTRQELAGLVTKGAKTGAMAEAELAKVTAQAKKVVMEVKSAAMDAKKQATKAVASAEKVVAKTTASASKLASNVQAEAKKVVTGAQTDAKKVLATAQADAKKVATVVKADVKAAKNRIGSVLDVKPKAAPVKKPVIVAKPSVESRANRATSKAKEAAGSAMKVAKETTAAVTKAVKNAG